MQATVNQRLINALLLNSSFIDNLGLMHGKMGIAIFFFSPRLKHGKTGIAACRRHFYFFN